MNTDILMSDSAPEADGNNLPEPRHFVVAVDFGTTFSSVAYVGYAHENQRRRIELRQIEIVDRYPDHPYGNFICHDVPTEIWYAPKRERPVSLNQIIPEPQLPGPANGAGDYDNDCSDSEVGSEATLELEHSYPRLQDQPNTGTPLLWGYGVQDQLKEAEYETDYSSRLSRFKLILDESEHTATVRTTLSETCTTLKKMMLIKEDTDIIGDYLEQLFRHTKMRLIESEGYTDASTVEFVLCIPAVWKSKAARQMQVAMTTAITNSGLGKLQNKSIDNLFIVSEPEAAAACVLASDRARLKVSLYHVHI